MNYDDYFLLKLIRQNQNAIVALASIVGYLKSQIITPADFATLVSDGTDDPNTLGIIPTHPNLVNMFWQKSADGTPETLWVWAANATSWK